MIPNIWDFGKSNSLEIVKRPVVAKGGEERWRGEA